MASKALSTSISIPVVDARGRGVVHAAAELSSRVDEIMRIAARTYTPAGLSAGDRISKAWLGRNGNPYLPEIEAIAARTGRPGAHLLNVSYEWGCTSGTGPQSDGTQVMLRTLDWPLDGLGRTVSVIHQDGPAGGWLNIGWPGFSGVITGMAPGRFAVAINQPPTPVSRAGRVVGRLSFQGGRICDWAAGKPRVWRSRALPPAHLLRQVFDGAPDYATAVRLLSETPVSTPVFYTVTGLRHGEGCVIERLPNDARVRRADPAVAVANAWVAFQRGGHARIGNSPQRQAAMERCLLADGAPFALAWAEFPVLNWATRLVAAMNPAAGRLALSGWEKDGQVTELLDVIP